MSLEFLLGKKMAVVAASYFPHDRFYVNVTNYDVMEKQYFLLRKNFTFIVHLFIDERKKHINQYSNRCH